MTLQKQDKAEEEASEMAQDTQAKPPSPPPKKWKKTSVAKLIPVRGPKADAIETGYVSGGEDDGDGYYGEQEVAEDPENDYYAKQAEKELIASAKQRGEQPIMRTRKAAKKREPKATTSGAGKKKGKGKGKGKGKAVGSEESSAAMSE